MTNKMKRRVSAAFTIVLLALAALLGLTVFFGSAAEDEGREAASFPAFLTQEGRIDPAFGANLSDYISDRLPLRNLFLRGYAGLRRTLFHEDINGSVIFGKDGYLFFGESADSFTGAKKLSDRGVFALTDALTQIDAYCKANDMRFAFTVAPNKNTICPQYMPARYVRADASDLDRLAASLAGTGVAFADTRSVLRSREGLYYKTDSHWNHEGACLAADVILRAAGRELPDAVANAGYTAQPGFSGDVAELLPAGARPTEDEQKPAVAETWQTKRSIRTLMDPVIETVLPDGAGSAVVYRDSFGNALFPLLAGTFGEMRYLRAMPVDAVGAKDDGADTLIWEIVERHLYQALNAAPIVPAQPADCPEGDILPQKAEVRVSSNGAFTVLSGTVPRELLNDTTRIGVLIGNADGAWRGYTAFQLIEAENLTDDPVDNGFTAYIPAQQTPEDLNIMLSLTENGETTYLQTVLARPKGD